MARAALARLHRQADSSEVELTISRDLAPLRMGSADIAIVSGPRDWKDLPVDLLAPLTGILACAPVLIGGKPAPRQLSELAQHRLLGVTWPRDQFRRLRIEWGAQVLQARLDAAEARFLSAATEWLVIEHGCGLLQVEQGYRKVLEGQTDPGQAFAFRIAMAQRPAVEDTARPCRGESRHVVHAAPVTRV